MYVNRNRRIAEPVIQAVKVQTKPSILTTKTVDNLADFGTVTIGVIRSCDIILIMLQFVGIE